MRQNSKIDPSFLPPSFLEKIKVMLNNESELEEFTKAMNTRLRKCIRINTLKGDYKSTTESLKNQGIVMEQMPWYKYGFFVTDSDNSKMKIGNTIEHFLGKIYVQEASSMLPVIALNPEPKDTILDIAAAPGSKTTQIAMHMNNDGAIIANEPQLKRISPLQDNLERSGSIVHTITRNDGRVFKKMPGEFDKVLVDAPCSVEGTFRKDLKARFIWTQRKVIELSRLQYQLLDTAYTAVKSGGTIVYSTCTFSVEENEYVIDKLLQNYPNAKIEPLKLEGLNFSNGLTSYKESQYREDLKNTVRIWPHKMNMEGFYLAKIIKE